MIYVVKFGGLDARQTPRLAVVGEIFINVLDQSVCHLDGDLAVVAEAGTLDSKQIMASLRRFLENFLFRPFEGVANAMFLRNKRIRARTTLGNDLPPWGVGAFDLAEKFRIVRINRII